MRASSQAAVRGLSIAGAQDRDLQRGNEPQAVTAVVVDREDVAAPRRAPWPRRRRAFRIHVARPKSGRAGVGARIRLDPASTDDLAAAVVAVPSMQLGHTHPVALARKQAAIGVRGAARLIEP